MLAELRKYWLQHTKFTRIETTSHSRTSIYDFNLVIDNFPRNVPSARAFFLGDSLVESLRKHNVNHPQDLLISAL